MKIKTITCHEVYNHGAALQEYALLYYLNMQGHEAEAIHYKPEYLSGHFNLWAVSNPKFNKPFVRQLYLLAKLPRRINDLRRKKVFDTFHSKYIPTGKVKYTSNEELKNNIPDADAYICGSDQIWNSYFQNGKDPSFYLDFVPEDALKISYAASFAIDHIDDNQKAFVKEKVSRLDAVSVRETSGLSILEDLGIKEAVQVLDPVFLLSQDHWNTFTNIIMDKFIFVYDFDSNEIIEQIAKKMRDDHQWKIYTVNNNIKYADKNFWLKGPETFLSLISQSQFNITNSFHAVAFSIIFQKQFVVLNRKDKINTRMRDLLRLFDLDSSLVINAEPLIKINYDQKVNLINEHSLNSKSFIDKFLKINSSS